jgi:hypothetical protein
MDSATGELLSKSENRDKRKNTLKSVTAITLSSLMPIQRAGNKEDLSRMMTSLSGGAAALATQAAAQTQASSPAASTAAAASTSNRTTAQDTVTISSAGQQLSSASADADRDGDSH